MKEKLTEFSKKIGADSRNSYKRIKFLSNKLNDSSCEKNYNNIRLEIMKQITNKTLCDFQMEILTLYFYALLFYIHFINDETKLIEKTNWKIKEKVKYINNKINSSDYFVFSINNDYINDFGKALNQIENLMYFPDCKINEYKYLKYLSEIESFINDFKKNTLNNMLGNSQILK